MPGQTLLSGTGDAYEPEEVAFLKAMAAYQKLNHRRFPTWGEALAVLRSLGYRRVAPEEPLPRFGAEEREAA